LASPIRQHDYRRLCGLPVNLSQQPVRRSVGEEARAVNRRKLRRIAEH
jgi:hypothetical protein